MRGRLARCTRRDAISTRRLGSVSLPPGRALFQRSISAGGGPDLAQGKVALLEHGPEGLFPADGGNPLVVVVGLRRLGRPLHFEHINVVKNPSVLANPASAEQRIVRGQLLHLADDELSVMGGVLPNGFQIAADARIDPGLDVGRHSSPHSIGEPPAESAGAVVEIPVGGIDERHALRRFQPEPVDKRDAVVTGDDLLEFVSPLVAEPGARPGYVEILEDMPLTPVGKIYKPTLRVLATARGMTRVLEAAGFAPLDYDLRVAEAGATVAIADEGRREIARNALRGMPVAYDVVAPSTHRE